MPSERTKVAVTIIDSSLRLLPPSHPGALVAHIGEMDFSTTLVGNSAETSFHLEVPALSIFLVDDLSAVSEHLDSTRKGQSHTTPIGIAYWKVRPMVNQNRLRLMDGHRVQATPFSLILQIWT